MIGVSYTSSSAIAETALQGGLVLAKNWETIFYGHFRSIFNHCDIIGLQSYRIRWKKRKIRAITPFKVIEVLYQSIPYATSF